MISFWKQTLDLVFFSPTQVARAIFWRLLRRRLRSENIIAATARQSPLAYRYWRARQDEQGRELEQNLRGAADFPSFVIVVHGSHTQQTEDWSTSIKSVEAQRFGDPLVVRLTGQQVGAQLSSISERDYVLFLRAGDRLAVGALARLGEAIASEQPDLMYGDEEHLLPGGGLRPWFKPDWNPELFLAQDYLSAATVMRVSLLKAALAVFDRQIVTLDALLLQATLRCSSRIHHLPMLIVEVRQDEASVTNRLADVRRFLLDRAECTPGPLGTTRVLWPLPRLQPLVSIIVPTRDHVGLLRACLSSIAARTDYQPIEIIIVDNGSSEPETLAYLDELRRLASHRVIRIDGPYNFSALNNEAVRQSHGEYVLLLNNDTEVINAEWLGEMMRYAVRDDVGAVGAKLLYDDHTIQHAGVVVGMGEAAGHAHRYLPNSNPGYFGLPHVAHFVSAVTAACLLVRKSKYESVGGLDETDLAIAFNDVDFCLKLEQAGWRNVYTPHAMLYHHESKSRGNDLSITNKARYMRELAALQNRWGTKTYRDPLHSPRLDRYSEQFIPSLL